MTGFRNSMKLACLAAAACALALTACGGAKKTLPYDTAAVERRTIVVSAVAAGAVEPVLTVDVKSKASGEIIQMPVETGDEVKAHDLLAVIDPREPRNALAQSQANLEVARAQLQNARAEMARADTFYKRQVITEVEYENARLAYASAKAQEVRAAAERELAQDQMDDTRVRAPISGTVIAKSAELGTVISSPTRDVGGGTVLLRMANLDTVQVRALVDETDIGKAEAGLPATISVDAYPNRQFEGTVLKIEPLATVQQNVTMFPVLVRIANPGHLLKPGMNTEVEIHVGRRDDVLAVPYAALRTARDVASAATVLGLDAEKVEAELAASRMDTAGGATSSTPGSPRSRAHGPTAASASPADSAASAAGAGGQPASPSGGGTITLPNGSTVVLPAGVTETQVRAAMQKRMQGGELSDAERALLRKVFAGAGGSGRGGSMGNGRRGARVSSTYIVFILREGKPTPVEIRTGLTDLDYIEVTSGLSEGDQVLLLPSASLVNSQEEMRQRMQRMTGGGGLPGVQQQQPSGQRSGQTR